MHEIFMTENLYEVYHNIYVMAGERKAVINLLKGNKGYDLIPLQNLR